MLGMVFLQRYQAVSFLGKGSMGAVYLARHISKPEVVVVKVIHPQVAQDPTFRQFFDREIESLSRLRHPCVVGLLEASFNDPAGPCLVMEFIPGVTLEALLNRHKTLPVKQVNRLLVPLCRALMAGHAQNVIHRDLKPANLMVTDPDTPTEWLKVMDFGLAQLNVKPHISLDRLRGKAGGNAFGTPIYIAPDALRGDPVDHRSDIYSVGVILFELLTGSPPFNYADADTVLNAHVKEAVPRFAQVKPGLQVPAEVEAIVRRCLEKYPNERPQTAREVAQEFGRACGVPLIPDRFPETATPAAAPAEKPEPATIPQVKNKHAITHQLDAYMPEPIAVIKLRGFVEDEGGVVVESQPGMIRVQLRPEAKKEEPTVTPQRSMLEWLGGGRKPAAPPGPPPDPIELLMYMAHGNGQGSGGRNSLNLTIVFKPLDGRGLNHPASWRARCDKLYFDLRGYLMAK